ncbi:phosphatidylserine/phosphatidylglycerophosphate/cardiolipin synthase-like enzyme [Rhodococcus sp. 27YEA15]|uniref:phospholipase D-like domain-containing protein n=1 Tax=Rhodococcus sp. 27YEA15 TaxID=3156259 RepID=UPI003C7C429C
MSRILVPGQTCWRIEPADNLACIVDAADYFHHAKSAMLQAEKRIMLVGWDFDTRIKLEPVTQTLDGPNRLGRFLRWLVAEKPELEIFVLKWNIGAFTAITRGMTPVFVSNWLTDDRLRFEIDGAHPVAAAHHQKIIVIDDALAFCGGIDMTVDRWDTSDHRDRNSYRMTPSGRRYGPWHDATTALDGRAAGAIGDMARARWKSATGEELAPVTGVGTPWPVGLEPTMRVVDVAVARTLPELGDRAEVREIEALYLAVIASTERTLYIESQYLASRTLAEAMAARLAEPDGPEIVLVIPRNADGWLEQKAMDGARHDLLHLLWAADAHDRFGVFYPVTESGEPIYVHAKVLVMDDRLLRIGSSNLNNRSMGFDTECDVAVEADQTGTELRRTITTLRRRLLTEHLDVDDRTFESALADSTLLAAVRILSRPDGRSLREFDRDTVDGEDHVLAENALMDPERTPTTLVSRIGELRRRVGLD